MRFPIEDGVDVKEGLSEGWSIPSEWYTEPAKLAEENSKVFARSWQYAGRLDQLQQSGDYITTTAGRVPIIVVRDREGELRAFINICPHRAHEVAQGSGRRQTFQCGYHAWTFNLDGTLRAAPRSECEPKFDKSELGLLPAGVAQWGPFVFVNADPEGESFETALENLGDRSTEMGFALDSYTFHETRSYEVECNWKVMLDNATECYHCEPVHRGFAERYSTVPEDFKRNLSVGKRCFSYSIPFRDPSIRTGHDFQLYYMWPNFMILLELGSYYWTTRFDPISPTRTIVVEDFFFHPSISQEDRAAEMDMMVDAIQEDLVVNESVQRGLNSHRLRQARFFVKEEDLLGHIQGAYYDVLVGSGA